MSRASASARRKWRRWLPPGSVYSLPFARSLASYLRARGLLTRREVNALRRSLRSPHAPKMTDAEREAFMTSLHALGERWRAPIDATSIRWS